MASRTTHDLRAAQQRCLERCALRNLRVAKCALWVTVALVALPSLGCSRETKHDQRSAAGVHTMTEARALWITRFDWHTPAELTALIDSAAAARFNVVFLQIPSNPAALYGLRMQRWNTRFSAVAGLDGGWDPLHEALSAARAHGLQVHVWLNTFYGWAASEPIRLPTSSLTTLLSDPLWWLSAAAAADTQINWQSPASRDARVRVAAFAAELVRRYGITGVHLDFARYPAPAQPDSLSLAGWQAARLRNDTLTLAAYRRALITAAVREVRDSVNAVRSDVVLSAAVWGIYQNSNNWAGVSTGYDDLFQDGRAWAANGLVDVLAPMIYWPIADRYGARTDFAYLADEHARANTSRHTYIGITLEHMMRTGEFNRTELLAEIERARRAHAQGISILSAARLRQQRLWSVLAEGPFRQPAEVPAMPWRDLRAREQSRNQERK